MYISVGDDRLSCKLFPGTLWGEAMHWLATLPPRSIQTFKDLANAFTSQFTTNKTKKLEVANLFDIKQNKNETLKSYLARFNNATVRSKAVQRLSRLEVTTKYGGNPNPRQETHRMKLDRRRREKTNTLPDKETTTPCVDPFAREEGRDTTRNSPHQHAEVPEGDERPMNGTKHARMVRVSSGVRPCNGGLSYLTGTNREYVQKESEKAETSPRTTKKVNERERPRETKEEPRGEKQREWSQSPQRRDIRRNGQVLSLVISFDKKDMRYEPET
ncbi:hypothetical protein CR513_16435, partial [Mucuna pruriens]